jgi:hypothetical protein
MILNYTCKQTNYNVLLIPGECYSKLFKKKIKVVSPYVSKSYVHLAVLLKK